jgi:hypothetical protein
MKWNSIRASLVRLFGRRATSVSPKILTHPLFEETGPDLIPAMARAGMFPAPPGEMQWPWSDWVSERRAFSIPGWVYCRFPLQFPGDRAVFVFGLVRESFGIYHTPFTVRHVASGRAEDRVLACMVHLRTGYGMGLFTSRHVAAQACELAENVDRRWNDVDPQDPETWGRIVSRVGSTWHGAGIVPIINTYAYQGEESHLFSVYDISPESLMEGRPEVLS